MFRAYLIVAGVDLEPSVSFTAAQWLLKLPVHYLELAAGRQMHCKLQVCCLQLSMSDSLQPF